MSLEMAESRVSDLRKREAVGEAWQWIVDLKEAAKSDRAAAEAQLNSIFKLGAPPTNLDGPTDGILVMTTTNPAVDAAVRLVTGLWMPFQVKPFHSTTGSDDYRMVPSASLPFNLLVTAYNHAYPSLQKPSCD